jgi:hypothetical protein
MQLGLVHVVTGCTIYCNCLLAARVAQCEREMEELNDSI